MTSMNAVAACKGKPVGRGGPKDGLLSQEEEARLALAWQKHKDYEARQRLVLAFDRFLSSEVSAFLRKMPVDKAIAMKGDLKSEAAIGMMKAADKFNPDKGFRFSTYARWWVRAAMQDYIISQHSLVRIGGSGRLRMLFFNLRKVMKAIEAKHEKIGERLTNDALARLAAEKLGVPEDFVIAYGARILGSDVSLNVPLKTSSEDGGGGDWMDFLEDEAPDAEAELISSNSGKVASDLIETALLSLSDRERDVIRQRKLQEERPSTLEELSVQYGLSRERIRQIEVRALEKMKRAIKSAGSSYQDFVP